MAPPSGRPPGNGRGRGASTATGSSRPVQGVAVAQCRSPDGVSSVIQLAWVWDDAISPINGSTAPPTCRWRTRACSRPPPASAILAIRDVAADCVAAALGGGGSLRFPHSQGPLRGSSLCCAARFAAGPCRTPFCCSRAPSLSSHGNQGPLGRDPRHRWSTGSAGRTDDVTPAGTFCALSSTHRKGRSGDGPGGAHHEDPDHHPHDPAGRTDRAVRGTAAGNGPLITL